MILETLGVLRLLDMARLRLRASVDPAWGVSRARGYGGFASCGATEFEGLEAMAAASRGSSEFEGMEAASCGEMEADGSFVGILAEAGGAMDVHGSFVAQLE